MGGIPAGVLHYRRKGRHDLSSFLSAHNDRPSGLPGEYRNFRHDLLGVLLEFSPELIGFPAGCVPYREVELPLCDVVHRWFHNTTRYWPLTVVDNIYHSPGDLRLVGIITKDRPDVVGREVRGLERAVRYFYYNFGVEAKPYLVVMDGGLDCREVIPPYLDERFKGIFT